MLLIVEAQRLTADDDAHVLALTWLQENLREAFQFLHRPVNAALVVVEIELYGLCSCTVARGSHVDRDRQRVITCKRRSREAQVGKAEGGIAQTMAEGEERLRVMGVGPSVANVDSFLVFLVDNLMVSKPSASERHKDKGAQNPQPARQVN